MLQTPTFSCRPPAGASLFAWAGESSMLKARGILVAPQREKWPAFEARVESGTRWHHAERGAPLPALIDAKPPRPVIGFAGWPPELFHSSGDIMPAACGSRCSLDPRCILLRF